MFKKMFATRGLLVLLAAVLLSACGALPSAAMPAGETTETLYVAPFWKTCQGVGPMLCLQTRATSEGEWQLFYNSIAGFTYEPGYLYQLKVKMSTVANPPADASSLRYTLVEIVSKTAVEQSAQDLTGSSWKLVTLQGSPVSGDEAITLEFLADGKLAGSAGCNRYGGGYTLQGVAFQTGALFSTKMACPEPAMQQETAYLQALDAMRYAQVSDGKLLLVSPQMGFLTFAKK